MERPLFSKEVRSKLSLFWILLTIITTSPSLFAQTDPLLFRDDFEREALGPDWQASSSWSIVDGSAYNFASGLRGSLRTTRHFSSDSYVLETAARGFTNSYWREFSLTFGQANLSSDSAYVLRYTPNSGGQLTLSRSTNNFYYPQPLDEVVIFPDLEPSKWVSFKIEKYRSGLIQVYLDKGNGYGSVPLLEAIDNTYRQLGHFGWQEDTQTAAEPFYVDWIEARKPPFEKPATKEKPAEDNLITQVSASSGLTYRVAKLNVGQAAFTDRPYTITAVPEHLEGASFVQTAMDDKYNASSSLLTMFIKEDALVYIAYDPRGRKIPAWLQDWEKTGERIESTDPGSRYFDVYRKVLAYGETYPQPFVLGGNYEPPAKGAKMNYLVIVIEKPQTTWHEAEDARLGGAAVVAKDHAGYSGTGFVDFINPSGDYLEWTVQVEVPGFYGYGFSYANGSASSRPLSVQVDAGPPITHSFGPTFGWGNWAYLQGATVFLARGSHTIRATATGLSGPNIDFLTLFYSSAAQAQPLAMVSPAPKVANVLSDAQEKAPLAYPNPFTESTTISYSLKERVPVYLTVYSVTGKVVDVLVNEPQEAGEHQVTFKANALAGGLYFYRLKAGNQSTVGRIVKH